MKRIGITVDNHKVENYQYELTNIGFTEIETTPFNQEAALIAIQVEDQDFAEAREKVRGLCEKLEGKKFKTA